MGCIIDISPMHREIVENIPPFLSHRYTKVEKDEMAQQLAESMGWVPWFLFTGVLKIQRGAENDNR